MSATFEKYSYSFDENDGSTAATIVQLVGSSRRILELGFGAGVISKALKSKGREVSGIEIDEECVIAARDYMSHAVQGDLSDSSWVNNFRGLEFDAVIVADVLEHVSNPGKLLTEIAGLLAEGGKIVCSIPNVGHIGVVAKLLCADFTYGETGILDATHLRFFTWRNIEKLFRDSGLVVRLRHQVKCGGWHEEFIREWQMLPAQLSELLADHPSGTVYQYVFSAVKTTERAAESEWLEADDLELKEWLERDR